MKIKEIREDGEVFYTEQRTVDDVFTIEGLKRAISNNNKMLEDLDNAILSAKTNMALNGDVLSRIKETETMLSKLNDAEDFPVFSQVVLEKKEREAAEIYFRSLKDLEEMIEARPKYLEGIEAIEKILAECKAVELPTTEPVEVTTE
jgi:HEAT repeat protein